MIRQSLLLIAVVALMSNQASARPILTEPVETVGRMCFEASSSSSRRYDRFDSPQRTYQTNRIPMEARLGLTNRLDIGFQMEYLSHRLEKGGSTLSGSTGGVFAPELKWALNDYLGLKALWRTSKGEKTRDEMPIPIGDDLEFCALAKAPTSIPIYLNVGYVFAGRYRSRFGINNGPRSMVIPGNIFQTNLSVEYPLKYHLSLLGEYDYFHVLSQKIDSVTVEGSEGSAADALAGLTWTYGGWNIGAGAGFGLMNESHTSFDIRRGQGDVTYHLFLSYRLVPTKPDR